MSNTGEKIIVEQRGDNYASEGSLVGLDLNLSRAMLFDAETELRLR